MQKHHYDITLHNNISKTIKTLASQKHLISTYESLINKGVNAYVHRCQSYLHNKQSSIPQARGKNKRGLTKKSLSYFKWSFPRQL